MKKLALTMFVSLFIVVGGYAQTMNVAPVNAFVPQAMGMGGAYVTLAEGYESLFFNPAGFANKNSFTLLSVGAWVIANPVDLMYYYGIMAPSNSLVQQRAPGFDPLGENSNMSNQIDFISSQLKQGLGFGAAAGFGFTTNGFAFGLNLSFDSYLQGKNILASKGYASLTAQLVIGLAIPIDLGGLKLSVGADIRPMLRAYAPINATQAISFMQSMQSNPDDVVAAFNGMTIYQGVGVAFDAGANLEMGAFTVGISLRDIFGTAYFFHSMPGGDYVNYLTVNKGLPPDTVMTKVTGSVVSPMNIIVGVSFRPIAGSLRDVIDPIIAIDLSDLIGVFSNNQSPWNLLHIGAEVRLLNFITLQAGLNQGYLTAGIGLHLFIIDLNASIFTREIGPYAGEQPSTGIAVELSIRF